MAQPKRFKLDSPSQPSDPWPQVRATESTNCQFGNYCRYYGYRTNDPNADDPRLDLLDGEIFRDKVVLDLGCNAGNVTISIGRRFSPKHIYGVDIDSNLISAANRNLKSLFFRPHPEDLCLGYFKKTIGPLRGFPTTELDENGPFPNNVSFHAANCVPKPGEETGFRPEFDCILALSLTKWIHMNFGDSGLKRLFSRVYAQLKPGGVFVLEPQPWNSYRKKAKRNKHTLQVFHTLTFKPDQFESYLLETVGFSHCQALGAPANASKGFQRPLLLFRK